jgi:ABC-2 type transport system permease protein
VNRLKWAVVDGWTITLRDLHHWARQPWILLVGLLFPVMIVLMFAYVFGGSMTVAGGGDYREFLMPGIFALTMVFGLEATFTAVATDAQRGVTDRFRSMPMSQAGVVLGRSGADMLNSAAGLGVLVLCGLLIGWRWHEGPARALTAVGLLLLLRFAVLWVGIHLALVLRSPEAVMALQILVWPLGFFSSAFASPEAMPGWLGTVVEWNPLSATAGAARQLFGNPGWGGESWVAQHSLLMAVVWPLVLTLVFLPLSVRAYGRLNR